MVDRRKKHECHVCGYTFYCRRKPDPLRYDCGCDRFIHRGHTIFVCPDQYYLFGLNDKVQEDNGMTILDVMQTCHLPRR